MSNGLLVAAVLGSQTPSPDSIAEAAGDHPTECIV